MNLQTPLFKNRRPEVPLRAYQKGWFNAQEIPFQKIATSAIEGKIPEQLSGSFFRNGPGLINVFGKKLNHPIDGDGLVCRLTFKSGQVTIQSRFVATKSHLAEQAAQKLLFAGQMGTQAHGVLQNISKYLPSLLAGQKPKLSFRDPANTSSFVWADKLYACYETKRPHILNPTSLETKGVSDLGGELLFGNMSAHFRYDVIQNRLVTISLKPSLDYPEIVFYELNSAGKVASKKVVAIPGLNYCHDFLVTENYYVVHVTPFVKISPKIAAQIALGFMSPGETMRYYSDLPSQFVFIPRYESDCEPIVIPCAPFHIFHFGHVLEKKEQIELSAVCLGPQFNMKWDQEIWLANATQAPGQLYEFKLNLKNRTCEQKLLEATNCEFCTIHPHYHQCAARFIYLMAAGSVDAPLPYTDVLKVNRHTGQTTRWSSNRGAVGEPVFIPRDWNNTLEEDDGWILVQEFEPIAFKTNFVILDAQNLHQGPVARITSPTPLPYGFHGSFSPEVYPSNLS